jgi:hypothetical protein
VIGALFGGQLAVLGLHASRIDRAQPRVEAGVQNFRRGVGAPATSRCV